ncbi:MAG: hypothetical protein MHPSP_004012, partial [Paramarteilia canceri]
ITIKFDNTKSLFDCFNKLSQDDLKINGTQLKVEIYNENIYAQKEESDKNSLKAQNKTNARRSSSVSKTNLEEDNDYEEVPEKRQKSYEHEKSIDMDDKVTIEYSSVNSDSENSNMSFLKENIDESTTSESKKKSYNDNNISYNQSNTSKNSNTSINVFY